MSERVKLNALLASGGPWKNIQVTGRADPVGVDLFNQKLSRKRANEMTELLQAAGIEKKNMSEEVRVELSKVNGEVITFGKLPSKLNQQSRRVDVEVVRTTQP